MCRIIKKRRELFVNLSEYDLVDKAMTKCVEEGFTRRVDYYTNSGLPGAMILKFRSTNSNLKHILRFMKEVYNIEPYKL